MAKITQPPEQSFFQKLFGSLFSSGDPEIQKRKQLKMLAKELSKNKFKFIKTAGDEALPLMAKFFYEIYKVVSSAQLILSNAQSSASLRMLVIDFSLNDTQRKISEHLTEESIKERGKTIPPQELANQIKNELSTYIREFDTEKATQIDTLSSNLSAFIAFANFDYHFLLKKFDSSLPERNFVSQPHFETIRAEYVADDLKDFISVAWALSVDADWEQVFKIIKEYKDIDVIPLSAWNKLISRLRDIKNSQVLEKSIQYITKDIGYTAKYTPVNEHIIDAHIEKLKTQTEGLIKKIQQDTQTTKSNELLMQLFGTTSIARLKYYSDRGNEQFERKSISGFTQYQPLNYMKAFLIDYFKKDIRELADLVLIRGKWTEPTTANQMSNAYYTLLETSEKITAFDDSFADDSELGQKFKNLLGRVDRDREAGKIIRTQLKEANERASLLITAGSQNFIIFAKNLRILLEDKEKKHPELLLNWTEVDKQAERPVKELGVDVYKKIYIFITLMQLFVQIG